MKSPLRSLRLGERHLRLCERNLVRLESPTYEGLRQEDRAVGLGASRHDPVTQRVDLFAR